MQSPTTICLYLIDVKSSTLAFTGLPQNFIIQPCVNKGTLNHSVSTKFSSVSDPDQLK